MAGARRSRPVPTRALRASVPHMSDDPTPRDPVARLLPAVAVVVLLLSLLPVADWIPGGETSPGWALLRDEWLAGTTIIAGAGILGAIAARSLPRYWPSVAPGTLDRLADRHWWPATGAIAALAFALYALVADRIAGRTSVFIDEIAQTIQARILADGALTAPAPAPLAHFATQHLIYADGRAFSQFPPGGPAAIALGTLAGAEWLVGPVLAALSVLLWSAWLRRTDERPATALLAVALLALAPFTMFMSGTRMNHVGTTTLLLAAGVGLATLARAAGARPLTALGTGLALGLAATVRPVDAVAFALPAAAWLLARTARDRGRLPDLLAAGLGVAVPLALLLWFNARTTGHPARFGYQLLWGPSHDLGFHVAPWGPPHTPARGVELVANYLLLLQRHWLETPVPALLGICGSWVLARRTSATDRYLLAAALLLVAAYWAYWHAGEFMGPRFLFPLVPLLALWTARFPGLLRARLEAAPARVWVWRGSVVAMTTALLVAGLVSVPTRWTQYERRFAVFRWSPADAAREAGVHDALVLVREGWTAQLVVRMWALGVSRPRTERYAVGIDACRLETALTALERDGADSTIALRTLDALFTDSARTVPTRLGSGMMLRAQPGVVYGPTCRRRLLETNAGVAALAPLLAATPHGNRYARDLHVADTALLAAHRGPVWLLAAEHDTSNARPQFYRVDTDSMRRAWAEQLAESNLR